MRTLHLIPIVHSAADLGNLAPQVADAKNRLFSGEAFDATAGSVRDFWNGLRDAIQRWDVEYDSLLLFQDALPVGPGDDSEMERRIVSDLAAQGSQNHQILQWLVDRGAKIIGTEDPKLLLEEYQLAKQSLESALEDAESDRDLSAPTDQEIELLHRRDAFIAQRINALLDSDSIGVLFLGMMHSLDDKLDSDIDVVFPFGQPRRVTIG